MRWLLGLVTGNPLMGVWLLLGAFGVGLGSGGYAAWELQAGRRAAADNQRILAEHEDFRRNERTASLASTGFEEDRGKNELRTRTITIEVEKIVDRPVYSNVCIDADGLRLLNDQIRRADAASQPGLKLPRPAGAG